MQFKHVLLSFVILSFVLITPRASFAQEATITPAASPSAMATKSGIIKYDLAYPGILPDNPLYKLKVARDKLTLFLMSDPTRKINFYLLQTDKGILASAMLVDKKEYDLAAQTALKAEHNYTNLTQELYRLPTPPDDAFFKKLKTAALKHQEVLSSIAKKTPKEKQKIFHTVADFSKRNWKEIEKYREQKEIEKLDDDAERF